MTRRRRSLAFTPAGPYRRVVGQVPFKEYPAWGDVEMLECGHTAKLVREPRATRRRCRDCLSYSS